jgi:predicted anti-sigma-YlaC factor YlaD
MKCKDVRELMPDMVLGLAEASAEAGEHLRNCSDCLQKFSEVRKTMALLDEWQAPEASPYFETRLQARLREEKAKEAVPRGFIMWIRKPVLAGVAAVLFIAGAVWFRGDFGHQQQVADKTLVFVPAQPGTAVGDLQALDNNHDMFSDFDVLDDLTVQQDVNENP